MSNVQLVNLGSYPNDGSGDDLRTAFIKSNASLTQLDLVKVEFGSNLGSGAPVFLDKQNTTLRFRSLESPSIPDIKEKISISYDSDSITLSAIAIADLIEDVSPQLGGSLDLNNFDIIGNGNILLDGDVSANTITANTVFIGDLIGNVTSSGLSTFANIDVNSGSIDNTIIGASTANLITGTTITATTGFVGNLTGNVTSSGLSTFANIDVNSGSIDNTVIGSSTATTIRGTTVTATTGFVGNLTGNVTSSGLSTFANIDVNSGSIDNTIIGATTATTIRGTTVTATTGFVGNLTGNVTSSGLSTFANIDVNSGSIDNTIIGATTANLITGTTVTATTGFVGNLTGDSFGFHTGDVNSTTITTNDLIVTNNATVDSNLLVYGTTTSVGFIGPLTGNVTGQVSDISNHNLQDLNNVSSNVPTLGQALVWSGTFWTPQTITTGVSRIVAGSNITISPTNGQGEVTINSTTTSGGGSGDIDFGSFLSPSDFSLDFGSF